MRNFLCIVATALVFSAGCKDADSAVAANATPTETAKTDSHDKHDAHDKGAASQPSATKTSLGKGETPAARGQVDDDGTVRRGSKLPAKATTVSVADCVKDAEKLSGKDVLVSGRVAQVCANKGCWWSIENPENPAQRIRVTHKDYGFFIPKDAKGRSAVAYGTLEVKKLSKEEAQHLAEDEGQKAVDPATLPTVELRLVATALEMKKPST